MEPEEITEELVEYSYQPVQERSFKVRRLSPGHYLVEGREIERLVSMTNLDNSEAIDYLQKRFDKLGIEERLIEEGAKEGDTIEIADELFDFKPSQS